VRVEQGVCRYPDAPGSGVVLRRAAPLA
jgi:hypothetical protein